MKKYVTKENIINLLLFIQFFIITAIDKFEFNSEVDNYLSFIALCCGYWINTKNKGE